MVTTRTAPTNYSIVVIAYLSFIALGLPGGLLGVAWPSIRDTFTVPSEALGTILFTTTAGYLFASLFNGRIVTALGIGRALLLAALLTAVGLTGFGLGQSWAFVVAMGVLFGLGQGILDAGMNLYFANHFTPRLMNWLHASFGLGAAIGPLLMTWLFSVEQSWRVGYFVMAGSQLILALIFILTLKQWQASDDSALQTENNPTAPPILTTLRQTRVLLGIALYFVFTGMESTAGNWSFTLFTEARSIDIITAGQWVSLYWWSFTLGRLVFGFIADRIRVNLAIQACMILVLVGTILLSLNLTNAISFIGLALVGFGLAPIFPLLTTATPERLGSDHATNAIGFQVGAAGLGIAAQPALAGYIAASAGLESIGPFLIGAALLSLLLFNIVALRK